MTKKELIMLQNLPLEIKIRKSKKRILEWIEYYGSDEVYLSFSGGIGSTVLLYLVNEVCREHGLPAVPALFVNTRNEYPEVVTHVFKIKAENNEKFRRIVKGCTYNDNRLFADQVVIRNTKYFLRDIIREKGYLVGSKKTSRCIHDARELVRQNPTDYYLVPKFKSLIDTKNLFSIPKQYQSFIFGDIEVSSDCCQLLKHSEMEAYMRETGRRYPMTGEQASESKLRTKVYLEHGCNGYDMSEPKSTPLGFWTSSDLCEYVKTFNVPYAECYGDIVVIDGKYVTTKEKRTGCMVCTAGASSEKGAAETRFQRMSRTHPKHYRLMITPLESGGYGVGDVLTRMKVRYQPTGELLTMEELYDLHCS